MARIFVSYRRKETAGHAGRLFDRLREHYGADNVFRDVDRLKAGDDFVEALARAVDSCDVFVLVIGRDWANVQNQRGERRLDDPSDFIRLELETALRRKILVLPVLVEGATMVDAEDLPEPLRPLARRQALELSEPRWDFDIQALLRRIDEVVKPARPVWKTGWFRTAAAVLVLAAAVTAGWRWWPRQAGAGDAAARPSVAPTSPIAAPPDVRTSPIAPEKDEGSREPAKPPSEARTSPTTPEKDKGSREPERQPQQVRVPKFDGQNISSATPIIIDLGLRPKTTWVSTGRYEPNIVTGQRPAPDALVERGSEVFLRVEMPLQPEEHAAGRVFLSLTSAINLDRDDSRGSDVGFDRTEGAGFYLHFLGGAQGARLHARTSQGSEPFDATLCRAATLSTSRVLIAEPVRGQRVCVRTTQGRTAIIELGGLTLEPAELALRYSTRDGAAQTGILRPPIPKEPPCRSMVLGALSGGFTFTWQAVEGASTYTVEVDCFDCASTRTGTWNSEATGRPFAIRTDLGRRSPIYSVSPSDLMFNTLVVKSAGRPLRWRVWGVTETGREGAKSEWCEFSFPRSPSNPR